MNFDDVCYGTLISPQYNSRGNCSFVYKGIEIARYIDGPEDGYERVCDNQAEHQYHVERYGVPVDSMVMYGVKIATDWSIDKRAYPKSGGFGKITPVYKSRVHWETGANGKPVRVVRPPMKFDITDLFHLKLNLVIATEKLDSMLRTLKQRSEWAIASTKRNMKLSHLVADLCLSDFPKLLAGESSEVKTLANGQTICFYRIGNPRVTGTGLPVAQRICYRNSDDNEYQVVDLHNCCASHIVSFDDEQFKDLALSSQVLLTNNG